MEFKLREITFYYLLWYNNFLIKYYFHVNGSIGIVQKIDFEIRPDLGCTTLRTSRKVVLDNPSASCLSVFFNGVSVFFFFFTLLTSLNSDTKR